MKKRKVGMRSQKGRPEESCLMCRDQSLQALPQGKEGSSWGTGRMWGMIQAKTVSAASKSGTAFWVTAPVRCARGRFVEQ